MVMQVENHGMLFSEWLYRHIMTIVCPAITQQPPLFCHSFARKLNLLSEHFHCIWVLKEETKAASGVKTGIPQYGFHIKLRQVPMIPLVPPDESKQPSTHNVS